MNKIYILLLIANIMSLMSMEKIFRTKDSSDQDIPLLSTNNNIWPSQKSFEATALYNESCKLSKNINTKSVLTLVTKYKETNINVDNMIKLAYNKNNMKSAMIFCILKKYILTKEALPNLNDLIIQTPVKKTKNILADTLKIECPDNTIIQEDTYNENTKNTHPAFHALRYNLMNGTTHTALFNYIYSDNKETPQNLPKTYDDLKQLFYAEALKILQGSKNDISILLHIIDCGKNLQPQKQESDFGRDIVDINLTLSENINHIVLGQTKPIIDRKRIALICSFIKQYNTERSSKTSPTREQTIAYNYYRSCSIALPDSFNSNLFDKTQYALKELTSLCNNIILLQSSQYKHVEDCFDSLYGSKDTIV